MKKNKIILIVSIIVIALIGGTVWYLSSNKQSNEIKSVALSLSEVFESEIKKEKDIEKVAKKIAESDVIIPEVQTFVIGKDDYLAGFKEEIKGYKKAVGIAPMIGTIPMVAYVFEVDEPKEFVKTLEDNAQLNWNICTVADEMKVTVVSNYIFFIMAPKSFE